jgi:hypothetical protein
MAPDGKEALLTAGDIYNITAETLWFGQRDDGDACVDDGIRDKIESINCFLCQVAHLQTLRCYRVL